MLRFKLLATGLFLLAGCLEPGPMPKGKHLYRSQNLDSPAFVDVAGETMLRFYDRVSPPSQATGVSFDLWLTALDGTRQRRVLANRSDRWGEQGQDSAGGHYFMANERTIASGSGTAQVASLVRLSSTFDETMRIENVANFSLFSVPISAIYESPSPGQSCPGFGALSGSCPQIFFERPAQPGQSYPTLYLWDGITEINLGNDTGSFQIQTMGNGNSYFILDDSHTLTRFNRPANSLESLRENVSRFSVSGDEHYVALAVTDPGKSGTVVRDLTTGAEIVPAKPNPSSWGGFQGAAFGYAMNAVGGAQAELHLLDLATGKDSVTLVPAQLGNLAGFVDRPGDKERLWFDSAGHGVFTGRDDLEVHRFLAGPLFTPGFTPDGAYLLYISRAAATLYDTSPQGALMFQNVEDVTEPPIMVSPVGLLVGTQNGASYFFTQGQKGPVLVFWSHLGRTSSDLFFADYLSPGLPTGLRLVARSIMTVSISAHVLFGILNVSQQDEVGDLVYRDIDSGVDVFFSSAVAKAVERSFDNDPEVRVAYVVRGRAESDRSGLWLASFVPPPPPDGGQ